MKSKSPRLLACTIFFFCCGLDSRPIQESTWSEAEWKWLEKNFHLALDHNLPLEKGTNIIVSCRSYESLQVGATEYSLSISEHMNAGLSVHVRVPDGPPIGQQLLVYHRDHPTSSINAAEKTLNFKDWTLTEQQRPTLTTAVQKLDKVGFGLSSDKVFLDPIVHEFHLSLGSGDVDAALVEYENPLVQWGVETRRALQVCGAGDLPTAKSVGASRE